MKYDEFAFFNQQLAAMLRDGIPLEGALKQLSADMNRGPLRAEIQALEADLAKGTPLKEALAARKLPDFYVRMVQVGAAGNDLPGMLTLLADHYQQTNLAWTKLKGLMVYPVIVLTAGFVLSAFLSLVFLKILNESFPVVGPAFQLCFWIPPALFGLVLLVLLLTLTLPALRSRLRWRLPAFKETSLAQVSGALSLIMKSGGNLGDALHLARTMEGNSQASRELAQWQKRLAEGHGKFPELARPGPAFPPLFIWLVSNSGEDMAAGLKRASEIYGARAARKIETLLYTALPLAILLLGSMILSQTAVMTSMLARFLNSIVNLD